MARAGDWAVRRGAAQRYFCAHGVTSVARPRGPRAPELLWVTFRLAPTLDVAVRLVGRRSQRQADGTKGDRWLGAASRGVGHPRQLQLAEWTVHAHAVRWLELQRVCLVGARTQQIREPVIHRRSMYTDDCERFIDSGCQPPTYELPLVEDASPGQVRCGCCGGNSFERIGTGTLAYRLKVIVGFENEVLEFQASDTFAACCDFEPSRYRCALCDVDVFDLADLADSRPWAIGARAVLPDGSEARVEAIGPDRIVGRHREPTAVCAGATYLLRDLRALDRVHPEQLALPV